ncbi:hypothetical protein PITC_004630 [Penicillium italicum]|uniref:Uncharacterized protein n=1 Tax=Penicillium italicum TaxID=40296 RepID=A0A0A2LAD9_PENIT|nr:hypothetical protein PITC_004630 [Penicillium italicum]
MLDFKSSRPHSPVVDTEAHTSAYATKESSP